MGSERGGGRVIEQGGLRTLDSGIHKSPQVTTLTMFLYNTSRAECSEAGVRRSGAVHGSRVRDLRVFAQMVHRLDSGEERVLSVRSPCRSRSGR